MSFKTSVTTKWNGNDVKIKGKKIVNKSSYEAGLIIEGQAKELCPVKYGYLKASINTQSKDQGTELESPAKYGTEQIKTIGGDLSSFKKIEKPTNEGETHVGTVLDYSPHVEFGTIKQSAQPFLRPALELSKGKTLEIFKVNGKYEFKEYFEQHKEYLKSRGVSS